MYFIEIPNHTYVSVYICFLDAVRLIIPFFHVISGADYREQPRLLFLFLISVIKCEDLCNYFVRINPALTEGLLVRESDRSSSWEQMFAKCF